MTADLLMSSGAKASVIAICGLLSVNVLPQSWVMARRLIALVAVWSLLWLPWISLSMPVAASSLPAAHLPEYHASAKVAALLVLIWSVGILFRFCRLVAESRLLFRIASSGASCGNRMRIVEGLTTPCTWGVLRPCILMPVAAINWSSAQWQAVVSHEQQHIRQHDGWHRIVAALIRSLFWWNPLVHSLCRRLEIESELCCDEAATATSSRRAYGEMLLQLATRTSLETVPAWAAVGGVRERIERIIAPSNCGRVAGWARALLVAGVLATGVVAGCCIDGDSKQVTGADLGQEAAVRLGAEAFPLH